MKIAVFSVVVLFSLTERYQELAACSLKVEAAGSYKITVPFYCITYCHSSDHILNTHCKLEVSKLTRFKQYS
jgi:hypothetical protein